MLRNGAVALAVLVALYALLGFLILPTLLKPRLEAMATERLERQATLGRLEFNPFTFRASLRDFNLSDRDPQRPFIRFETLDLDISLASIRHWAPVLDAVHLVRPQVDLTRHADGTYSVDDLAQRPAAKAEEPTPQFSVNNIEVDDGTVTLDDRPHQRKIVVSNIGIGIPFLSSIPHDAAIRVNPRLEGAVDGTRFALTSSSTSPFADMADATLELNLDGLPLAHYAEYAPLPGGMKVTDGALTTRLKLAFVTEKGVAREVSVSGAAKVDKFALARRDGTPLVGARAIDVTLAKLDWLARSIALDRVVVESPDGDLRRGSDGTLEFARIFGTGGKATPASAPARPWSVSVADAHIADGTIRVADTSVSPAFQVVLSNVAIEGKTIASTGGQGTIGAQFDVDDGARFELQGEIDLAGQSARGHFSCKTFHLAKLYPYYASAVNLDVHRGTLDLAGDFDAAQDAAGPRFTLAQGAATLTDIETGIRGEEGPFWSASRGDLEGVAFDLAKRDITIDRLALQQGSINIVREANGTLNFERLVSGPAMRASETRPERASAAADGWHVLIRRYSLERVVANVEDRTPATPVKLRISDARLSADNFSNAPGAKSAMDFTARVGSKGRVRVRGDLGRDPLGADVRINASGIDLLPLRPYFDARTNVVVTGGSVGATGRLLYATGRGGAPRVTYKGDVTIADFGSLDRPTSQELVRWKTLQLTGVDTTTEPFKLAIGAAAMDQFYARVILDADATLNLKRLLVAEAAAPPEAGAEATTAAGVTTKELAPAAESRELPIAIGRIEVSNGEVQYSDFFVQPNYNAHLTGVAGSVSALSATQAGTVEVAASVEGTAPVDVRGTINPFARELQLDLTGKATDVDLPPLTPYSVKYAGYGIQKGKLSLEVHYKIDDRKLAATNKLRLDQLTFGEHVDSPSATKLPVLLAVSLLKDRNGVINLDLPIQGTLDDPKFSVWRVVVQIFVNLITKAVTAPFALLASIGGGGGEQLAYVEFAPGRADLSGVAVEKLGTLAKALNDRPGLKLDAVGRAVPEIDRDGLRKAALERALRAQKQKALAAEGESAPPLESLTIDAAEYPKLLEAVYRATDLPDKPRNVFGIAKKIPPEEMEAMLLASYRADDEALATLANRRAQAVKEWFAREGAVAPERIFVLAPKLTGEGITDKAAATRVDFAIR